MQIRASVTAILIAAMLWSPVALRAQQKSIADTSVMKNAVAAKVAADDVNRQTVRRVLTHPQVREVADRFGLSVQRAETAMASLSGAELAELAASARAVEDELVGGQRVIVISVTTLLLIIILVLLIAD